MDQGTTDRGLSDRGLASAQFVITAALGLVFFAALANLVVVQYVRGAIQSALDQGARVASVTGSSQACAGRVDEVLAQLLGGRIGDGVNAGCTVSGAVVTARASALVDSWTPWTDDFRLELVATATLEGHP